MDRNTLGAIWLSSVPFLMPRYQYAMVGAFGSPGEAWEAARCEPDAFRGILPDSALRSLRGCLEPGRAEKILEACERQGIRPLVKGCSAYPARLAAIYDPPLVLYVRGGADLSAQKMVAMVGTRRPTEYGRTAAYHLAGELAMAGVTVVSGLAYGLDISAHRGCLDAGGATVAVLGCGVDIVYPATHAAEARRMLENGGGIVSEYAPGTGPQRAYFPARNRIISGLVDGVIVVEAPMKSGTMHTVRSAQDQGREVLAVPGNINVPQGAGSNQLIGEGARPVFGAGDVLDQLGYGRVQPGRKRRAISLSDDTQQELALTDDERLVYEYLARVGEGAPDDFAQQLGLPMERMNSLLTILELRGILKKLPGNRFMVNALIP